MFQLINYKNSQIIVFNQEGKTFFKRLNASVDLTKSYIFNEFTNAVSKKLKVVKKKLSLKGLGYKVILEDKFLVFKLNFSHTTKLEVPDYINRIVIGKTKIIFESYDSILLGNYIEKIYNLRPKDSYKRKGFSLASKVVPKKEIKKK